MKVFISWSGSLSKSVATVLKKYIPAVLPDVEAFMFAHDIGPGSKWAEQLAFHLETSDYGILCLTPGNLNAPWLLFEAGAFSKFTKTSLCGLLLEGLKETDISGPLAQYQNKQFAKDGLLDLFLDINAQNKKGRDKEQITLLFDAVWPKVFAAYGDQLATSAVEDGPARKRTDRELIEEVLSRVRSLEGRASLYIPVDDLSGEDLLQLRITPDTLTAYSERRFPSLPVSNAWQSQLLRDINHQKYQFVRDIDHVLNRAMPALERCRIAAPALFKHSTDYLTKALGFVDPDFRAAHPWPSTTLAAFEKWGHLVADA